MRYTLCMQHKSLFVSLIPQGNVASLLQDEQSALCKHFGANAIYPLFCPIALLAEKNEIVASSATMTANKQSLLANEFSLENSHNFCATNVQRAQTNKNQFSSILSEYKNFFQSEGDVQNFTLSNLIVQDGAFYRALNFNTQKICTAKQASAQNNLQGFKNCALAKILQLKQNAFCYGFAKDNITNTKNFATKDISFAVCRLDVVQVEVTAHTSQNGAKLFDTQWHIIEETWLNLRKK